jgi:3-hydroxyacyl-[acyl-carrier-protein] dehydratase
MSKTLMVEDIQKLIPHRYPMLLVDRVEDVVEGESAVGIKSVTINEWFFQGHFPEKPVMPGVLIVEALAQTAGILVMKSLGFEGAKDKLVFFMSIDKAKFRKPVVPGDFLHLKVQKIKSRGMIWTFEGHAYVGDTLAAEAVYTAMIADNKD